MLSFTRLTSHSGTSVSKSELLNLKRYGILVSTLLKKDIVGARTLDIIDEIYDGCNIIDYNSEYKLEIINHLYCGTTSYLVAYLNDSEYVLRENYISSSSTFTINLLPINKELPRLCYYEFTKSLNRKQNMMLYDFINTKINDTISKNNFIVLKDELKHTEGDMIEIFKILFASELSKICTDYYFCRIKSDILYLCKYDKYYIVSYILPKMISVKSTELPQPKGDLSQQKIEQVLYSKYYSDTTIREYPSYKPTKAATLIHNIAEIKASKPLTLAPIKYNIPIDPIVAVSDVIRSKFLFLDKGLYIYQVNFSAPSKFPLVSRKYYTDIMSLTNEISCNLDLGLDNVFIFRYKVIDIIICDYDDYPNLLEIKDNKSIVYVNIYKKFNEPVRELQLYLATDITKNNIRISDIYKFNKTVIKSNHESMILLNTYNTTSDFTELLMSIDSLHYMLIKEINSLWNTDLKIMDCYSTKALAASSSSSSTKALAASSSSSSTRALAVSSNNGVY